MKHYILSGMMFIPLASFLQTTLIPDVNFEQKLISLGYDTGTPDGSVPTVIISSIFVLDCSDSNISSLSGIEDFSLLTELYCDNNQLTSLDVSQNTDLQKLHCYNNQLSSLILPQGSALTELDCHYNLLASIDLSQNPSLNLLNCWNNSLSVLNVSSNTQLTTLSCYNNFLTSLDLSQNLAITSLYCNNNQLTWIDLSQNLSLTLLHCYANLLTGLNVSQNTVLTSLACNNNQLVCLNVKNGNNTAMTLFQASANPGLSCIEVDDIAYSTSNWSSIDPQSSFSISCSSHCYLGLNEPQTTDKKQNDFYDLLGRKVLPGSSGLLLKVFQDGHTEKQFYPGAGIN